MTKPNRRSSVFSFPLDRRKMSDIEQPSFEEAFPNASDKAICCLFSDYGIEKEHIDSFKNHMSFYTKKIEPKYKRKRARSVKKAADKLLEVYNNQEMLEILYEGALHPAKEEIAHDNLVASLNKLVSVTQDLITRYEVTKSTKKGSYGHLVRGVQWFLYDIDRPYKNRSVSNNNHFNTVEFARDAIIVLLDLNTDNELKFDAVDHAIRKGIEMVDAYDDALQEVREAHREAHRKEFSKR